MSSVSHNMHNGKGKAGVKLEIAEKAYNNEHRNEPWMCHNSVVVDKFTIL